ncbi:MAG: hypothetical protein VYA53_02410 [Acidobacteriota bacterium]|nr:hypothetical protein [Acidobacteriota bacterium]
MNCEEVRIQVPTLLDDIASLNSDQINLVERHLNVCSLCSKAYQEELEIARWFAEASNFQLEPPVTIWEGIHSQIAVKSTSVKSKFQFPFPLLPRFNVRYALASVTIISLIALGVLTLSTPPHHNAQMLAELQSYELETEGNPFLAQMRLTDPFLDIADHVQENPFDEWRNVQ